jgi:aspartate 1-decarboxylase
MAKINSNRQAPAKTFAVGDKIVFYDYERGGIGSCQTVFAKVVKVNPKNLIADTKFGERFQTLKTAAQKFEDLF